MNLRFEAQERKIIGEQAVQWLCDLRNAGPQEQAAFLEWLKRSPRHVGEFLLTETLWQELKNKGIADSTDLEQLTREALADEASPNVIALNRITSDRATRTPVSGTRPWRRKPVAVAAAMGAVAITAALGWMSVRYLSPPVYSTAIGEQRAIRLPDGSLLNLNTGSRVQIRFTDAARDIRLLKGEALFTVQRDARRPFRVTAGNAVIQALGTQFNVYCRADATDVAVIEGAVEVRKAPGAANETIARPARLAAGESIQVSSDGSLQQTTQTEASDTLAWRERRLVFRGETLENVATEFNRYNQRHIRLADDIARTRQLSGTFDVDDPYSLILFLDRLEDLAVERREEEFLVHAE